MALRWANIVIESEKKYVLFHCIKMNILKSNTQTHKIIIKLV